MKARVQLLKTSVRQILQWADHKHVFNNLLNNFRAEKELSATNLELSTLLTDLEPRMQCFTGHSTVRN